MKGLGNKEENRASGKAAMEEARGNKHRIQEDIRRKYFKDEGRLIVIKTAERSNKMRTGIGHHLTKLAN